MSSRKRILEELDRLEPRVARAFQDAVQRIGSRVRLSALEDAIRAGDIERAARVAGISRSVWGLVTEAVRGIYIEGGVFQAEEAPARLGFDFDVTNPRAENWLRTHSSEFVTRISAEQREAIREAITAGAAAGIGPRTTALDIVGRIDRRTGRRTGGIVGLTEQQATAVTKARAALKSGDPKQMRYYLGLTKRDMRFDRMVERAIDGTQALSAADVDRITGRLSDRYLKLRGDTIAASETLTAFNTGADDALRQAVDEGLLKEVVREWDSAGDARVRPDHAVADGQRRGLNDPFNVGGALMMHPGDPAGGAAQTIRCRCVAKTVSLKWAEE